MTTKKKISDNLQKILDLINDGKTKTEISEILNISPSIVSAQITRLKTKKLLTFSQFKKLSTENIDQSINGIKNFLEKSGPANYDISAEARKIAEKFKDNVNIEPMILLGITIQYVKLCGGRINAHKIIEDVYDALRLFSGGYPSES